MSFALSGHYNPEVGRAFEDSMIILLERLGYVIWRRRDVKTGLDVVMTFYGDPNSYKHSCEIFPPSFSPNGIIAISAKKGGYTERDVKELLKKVNERERVKVDGVEKEIESCILTSNQTMTESKINKLLARGVYCWDLTRILFYANKTRICRELSINNPIREHKISEIKNVSYLMQLNEIKEDFQYAHIVIFYDEHKKEDILTADTFIHILEKIYETQLMKILEPTPLKLEISIEIHSLDYTDYETLESVYKKYAQDVDKHPNVTYPIELKIYSYSANPWMPFLNLLSERFFITSS